MNLTKQVRVIDSEGKGVPGVRVQTHRGIQSTDSQGRVIVNVGDPSQNVNIRVKNGDKNFMFVELPTTINFEQTFQASTNGQNTNGGSFSQPKESGIGGLLILSLLGFGGYKMYQKYKKKN